MTRDRTDGRTAHASPSTDDDTAAALGSGSLPVLGTPRLLAWCEAATCAAIEPALAAGRDQRRHPGRRSSTSRASPVGPGGRGDRVAVVRRRAAAPLHRRRPAPCGGDGKVVATGEITRVVVDAERFLSRL